MDFNKIHSFVHLNVTVLRNSSVDGLNTEEEIKQHLGFTEEAIEQGETYAVDVKYELKRASLASRESFAETKMLESKIKALLSIGGYDDHGVCLKIGRLRELERILVKRLEDEFTIERNLVDLENVVGQLRVVHIHLLVNLSRLTLYKLDADAAEAGNIGDQENDPDRDALIAARLAIMKAGVNRT